MLLISGRRFCVGVNGATRHRIITTGMPGMAAKNASGAHVTAFAETMSRESVLSIARTRGIESALIANQQAERVLVNSNELDSKFCHHVELPVYRVDLRFRRLIR